MRGLKERIRYSVLAKTLLGPDNRSGTVVTPTGIALDGSPIYTARVGAA